MEGEGESRKAKTAGSSSLGHIKMFGFDPVIDGRYHTLLNKEMRAISVAH